MSLMVVSTIVRNTPPEEQSSFLYVVDAAANSIVEEIPVPENSLRASDPNPRGGFRGARGISARSDRLAVATWNRIHILDPTWRTRGEISHPLLGGIHDILAEEDGIWVCSTAADLLLKVGWDGEILRRWHWATDVALARVLGYPDPPQLADSIDFSTRFDGIINHNRVHLNGVCRSEHGLLLSFGLLASPAERRRRRLRSTAARAASETAAGGRIVNRVRAIRARSSPKASMPVRRARASTYALVELKLDSGDAPGQATVLFDQPTSTPNHNVLARGDSILYNDSEAGSLVVHDRATGETIAEIAMPGDPPFARGLCEISGNRLMVGGQRPAAVYRLDPSSGTIESVIELSARPTETVYAIAPLPASFSKDAVRTPREWLATH